MSDLVHVGLEEVAEVAAGRASLQSELMVMEACVRLVPETSEEVTASPPAVVVERDVRRASGEGEGDVGNGGPEAERLLRDGPLGGRQVLDVNADVGRVGPMARSRAAISPVALDQVVGERRNARQADAAAGASPCP